MGVSRWLIINGMYKEKTDRVFTESLVEFYRKFRNLQLSNLELSRI